MHVSEEQKKEGERRRGLVTYLQAVIRDFDPLVFLENELLYGLQPSFQHTTKLHQDWQHGLSNTRPCRMAARSLKAHANTDAYLT